MWSSSRERIGIFRHARWWFVTRRRTELVFIVWLDDTRVGYTRCKPDPNGVGAISIALSSDFRGCGYGCQSIQKTVAATSALEGLQAWRAIVHAGNTVSVRAFERAGFHMEPHTAQSSVEFVGLQLSREQWLRQQVERHED
jgi:RimJ/RimL family protein N-acetyltransferase